MIVFPICKINLGLRVLNKRADGYHNIETIFYPVPLKDALEIVVAPSKETIINFSSSGHNIQGNVEDNLCNKACRLLQKYLPPGAIKIHLHKNIPAGAGLGGGSADAAFTLQLLNDFFSLQLSLTQLTEYALQLGSDCPFFILNSPCIATGRGEVMEKISLSLSGYELLLVNPGIHVNTTEAFASLQLSRSNVHQVPLKEIIGEPADTWKFHLKNDFEEPVLEKYPV